MTSKDLEKILEETEARKKSRTGGIPSAFYYLREEIKQLKNELGKEEQRTEAIESQAECARKEEALVREMDSGIN